MSSIPYEKYVVGVILSLLILSIVHWDVVSSFFKPRPILSPLCEYGGGSFGYDSKFIDAEKAYLNVPDYSAEIFIKPVSEKVNVGSTLQFSYTLLDNGIQKLNKSYFYIFIFDSDDKLRAIFPCFCGQDKSDFSIQNYNCNYNSNPPYCYIREGSTKFREWAKGMAWEYNGQSYSCPSGKDEYCISNTCVPRSSFVDGEYNGAPIIYSYPVDKPGSWKIYSFLFDEEVKRREYNPGLPLYSNNPISMGFAKFEVVKEQAIEPDFFWYFREVVIILIAFLPTLGLSIRFYERAKEIVLNHRNKILMAFVLLLVLVLITSFFCKVSCFGF